MICCIKAGSFKHDADRQEHLAKCEFPAFRAFLQNRIVKMLLPVKLNATVLASIGIDRHRSLSFINSHYSPASKRFQEEADMSLLNNSLTTALLALGSQTVG